MANHSQYKNLELPLSTEKYSIEVFNANSKIIDEELHKLDQKNEQQDNLLAEKSDLTLVNGHISNQSNPHNVTKDLIGLSHVEDKSSEQIRNEITDDNISHALGYTPCSPAYVDNKLSAFEKNIVWKSPVATYDDILTTYPAPKDGWTVSVNDTDYTYRYDDVSCTWVLISANSIPIATNNVDGKLSKEDHAKYEDSYAMKHSHKNKNILDTITEEDINAWNSVSKIIDANLVYVTTSSRNLYRCYNELSNSRESIEINGNGTFDYVKLLNNVLFAYGCQYIGCSSDGRSWSVADLNSIDRSISICDMEYYKGLYIAVGFQYILYSKDGIQWNKCSGYIEDTGYFYRKIAFSNDKIICVGNNVPTNNAFSYYSADGINWSIMYEFNDLSNCSKLTYGNGTFVCCGDKKDESVIDKLYYCNDGKTWNEITTLQDGYYTTLAYVNNQFVMLRRIDGVIKCYYSTDCINWNEYLEYESFGTNSLGLLSYADGAYYLVTGLSHYKSTDFIHWEKVNAYFDCIAAKSIGTAANQQNYVDHDELVGYAQPIITGEGLTKITYSSTEPEQIQKGEIVFVYEE